MSSAATGAGVVEGAVGSLSTEDKVYRSYAKLDENGVITVHKAQAGAQKVDATTGIPVNWKKLEDAGLVNLNENKYTFYSVKSEDGAALLVPEASQRVYIFQRGLDAIQNAAAAFLSTELKEGTQDPLYNQETIDLKEYINEPPQRRSKSELDKLIALLTAMGVPPERQASVLEAMIAAKQPAQSEESTGEEVSA